MCEDFLKYGVEELLLVDAVLGVEAVVGTPVLMLLATGAEEVGDGGFFGGKEGG